VASAEYKAVSMARLERDFYQDEKGRWAISLADAFITYGPTDSVTAFYLDKYKEAALEFEAAAIRYETLTESWHADTQAVLAERRAIHMKYFDE